MPKGEKQTLKIGEGLAGPGRPKGIPNKSTALLKDAILLAAQGAGDMLEPDGGIRAYLQAQAIANPGPFLSLVGKVLPLQLIGDKDNPVMVVTAIDRRIVDAKKPE